MENTESGYCMLLCCFKLFVEKRTKATKRHLIINVAELNQPIYFKSVLTSNGSEKICYFGREVIPFSPHRK